MAPKRKILTVAEMDQDDLKDLIGNLSSKVDGCLAKTDDAMGKVEDCTVKVGNVAGKVDGCLAKTVYAIGKVDDCSVKVDNVSAKMDECLTKFDDVILASQQPGQQQTLPIQMPPELRALIVRAVKEATLEENTSGVYAVFKEAFEKEMDK